MTRREVPTHDGGSVHLVEYGEGRPLVLLHGVTLGAEVWAPIMHLVGDRFRVIAPRRPWRTVVRWWATTVSVGWLRRTT